MPLGERLEGGLAEGVTRRCVVKKNQPAEYASLIRPTGSEAECESLSVLNSVRVAALRNTGSIAMSGPRPKEIGLSDDSKTQRADAQFRKLQRAEDGKKAMSEYEAEGVAMRAKTAKLRALRLARDSAEQAAAPPPSVPVKKAKKKKLAAGSLSDWMKAREDSGRNT
jgi:hypothetical protein